MALISILSAKGSPGCTTTALGLTLRWGSPAILTEADIAGSSLLAGYFQGEMHQDRGVFQLALRQAATRRIELTDLWDQAITIGLPPNDGEVKTTADVNQPEAPPFASLIPGIPSATQAGAVRSLWGDLATSLRSLESGGVDALVDLGRVDPRGMDDRAALLSLSDQILLVTRSRLPDVQATITLAELLRTRYDSATAEISPLGLVVVGPGQPYDAGEIADACGIRLAGTLAWDPVSAEVYSLGSRRSRRFETTSLNKSLDALATSLRGRITLRKSHIAGAQDGGKE